MRACWSVPLKLKPAVYWRELTIALADLDLVQPSEISSHTVFPSSSASRDWST